MEGYYEQERMDVYKEPYALDVKNAAIDNTNYRETVWTGDYLQMTFMHIPPRGDIGAEIHEDTDQMIRVEEGYGLAVFGNGPGQMRQRRYLSQGDVFYVPAGTWHNVINRGNIPLKLSSIYGPPHHPVGTVQPAK